MPRGGYPCENLVLATPVEELPRSDALADEPLLRVALPQHDQPGGIRVGQRLEDDRVEDAEHGRRCADSDRKRQQHMEREDRLAE